MFTSPIVLKKRWHHCHLYNQVPYYYHKRTNQPFNPNQHCSAVYSPHKKSRCFASTTFFFRSLHFTTLKNPFRHGAFPTVVLIVLHSAALKNVLFSDTHSALVLITLHFSTLKYIKYIFFFTGINCNGDVPLFSILKCIPCSTRCSIVYSNHF